MAVAKQCDICGVFYEDIPEKHFTYEEDGKSFTVNSIRLGNWNPKIKGWDSIVSAYDICKDCGKELTQKIFDLAAAKGNDNLRTRDLVEKRAARDQKNES